MEEDFVTFEIAKDLMELGYNCPSFGRYETMAGIYKKGIDPWGGKKLILKKQSYPSVTSILAPLWQSAIEYLQENYKIYVYQVPINGVLGRERFCWKTGQAPTDLERFDELASTSFGDTNYEARMKAVKEAIYLVKNISQI